MQYHYPMRRVVGWVLLLFSALAHAHDPSISGLKIILEKDRTIFSVQTHLSTFGKAKVEDVLPQMLKLAINGRTWVAEKPEFMIDKPTDTVQMQAVYPGMATSIQVLERLFPDNPNSKLIVTVLRDGESVGDSVLTNDFLSYTFGKVEKPTVWHTVWEFLTMGIEHILSGPDHLLFIFGLMLARPRIRELIKVATAFTVAHSITLSLCALHLFSLPSKIVEPLIALSIVAVAAEKFLRPNDKVWRTVLIAFCFGLIHGFGFAGALTEAGLPPGQAAVSLASFNIGVELVQISIILVGIPILTWMQDKKPKAYQPVSIACAVCISLMGAFWFVDRIVHGG